MPKATRRKRRSPSRECVDKASWTDDAGIGEPRAASTAARTSRARIGCVAIRKISVTASSTALDETQEDVTARGQAAAERVPSPARPTGVEAQPGVEGSRVLRLVPLTRSMPGGRTALDGGESPRAARAPDRDSDVPLHRHRRVDEAAP